MEQGGVAGSERSVRECGRDGCDRMYWIHAWDCQRIDQLKMLARVCSQPQVIITFENL